LQPYVFLYNYFQTNREIQMVNSRAKGSRNELKVAADLYEALGIKFERILDQTRQAGLGDLRPISGSFPFTLELKHYKEGVQARPEWWDQAITAAQLAGNYPALLYRYNRQPVRCRIPLQAVIDMPEFNAYSGSANPYDWRYACEVDFDTFCMICRELM
jgi:hypothetical protein